MNAVKPRDLVSRLMDGYLNTQMVHVAVRLGLFDLLGDGSRTDDELAAAASAAPEPLHRLLRGLVMEGLLTEEPNRRYAATDAGRLLRADIAGTLRGAALARGALYYRAATGLLETVRRGGTAFRHAYGVELFEHIASCPEDAEIFQLSMMARSHQEADAVVRTYDFARADHVVDVGGGYGVTLAAILRHYPRIRGTLFDRRDVTGSARTRLAPELIERMTVMGGDFFESVPRDGDVYVLSRVLHDWNDADAVRILTSCRNAVSNHSRLLIVEALLGDEVHDHRAAVRMDLHMLTLTHGRERTAAEFAELLRAARFRFERILTPDDTPGLHILEAVPDA